jgi:L-malate glycosyltransferase
VSDRFRILLTVPDFDSSGSPYREIIAIAKYLPREEFALTICSLRESGYSDILPMLRDHGIQSFIGRFRARGRTLKHYKSAIQDQSLIDTHGPYDLQHSLDFTPSPFEALMARWKGRPYIYNQRNMNEDGSFALLRMKIRLSTRIIAISEPVIRLLLQHGASEKKVRKVYLGIDSEDVGEFGSQRAVVNGAKSILCVGHLVPRKRHQDAIRALAKLVSKMPNLRLKIAGAPDHPQYVQQLRQLVEELNLTDRIDFLGIRFDVPQLMREADVLLLCSENEAFGWVILEAQSVGLPVIASAVDGPAEVIVNNQSGLLVQMGNVEGYADALWRVFHEPGLAERLIDNGRRIVEEKYTARRMVEQIVGIYKEVVA